MNSQGNLSEYCFSHKYELRRKFTNNPDWHFYCKGLLVTEVQNNPFFYSNKIYQVLNSCIAAHLTWLLLQQFFAVPAESIQPDF